MGANNVIESSPGTVIVTAGSLLPGVFSVNTQTGVVTLTAASLGAVGLTQLAAVGTGNGGNLVGFEQAFGGAVPRTIQTKAADFIALNDFGATGFTAMTAAVTALQGAGGGTLKMPVGSQNTPVPGFYWGGVLQSGNINGVVIEYDGPNVPVSMFFEQYGTNYVSQRVFRYQDGTTHAGHGHSVVHIENNVIGTGAIGPTNADFCLSLSLKKLNANTGTAAAGEMDGMYIAVRNDGSNSDTTAMLLDVGNYGVGFNAAFEANITTFSSGTPNFQMDVQCGVIDSRTNNQYGLVLAAQVGTLGYGILFNSLAGSNWTNLIVGSYNQIGTYLLKATGVTYLTTLDGTKNISFGVNSSTGAYYINVASDSLQVLSLDQVGNLSIGGYLAIGNTHLIGTTTTTATAGSATLPSNPAGFIAGTVLGTACRIPYYNA